MIRLRDVSYTYPEGDEPVLRDVDLDVATGEICAVLGANGAGKSTLAQVVAGFCPHLEGGELTGMVEAGGLDVANARMEEIVTRVGLVLQNPFNQISGAKFTVREEVAFGLENLGVPVEQMADRVAEVLDTLNIGHLAARSPYELSGGQQQLVALASILVMRPQVMVLDEPTSQLDPAGTDLVLSALHGLRTAEVTTLLVEHKLEQVDRYADRAVVLVDGRVRAAGSSGEVLRRDELEEWGVGGTRFSRAARELRAGGVWDPDAELPVSLEEAVDSFGRLSAASPSPCTEAPARGRDGDGVDIVVRDLVFRYPSGVTALDGVDLTVRAGERVAIVGENGAGKTTLVKHLNGIHRPTGGRVLVGEWDTGEHTVAQLAHRVGYLFQNPADQLFARTVRREVEFGPRNLGYPPDRVAALTAEALAATALDHADHEHPYQLTQAERKRVALASVLAMDTPVVVLDEPTTGQDFRAVEQLHDVVATLAQAGRTVVAVTHDMDFAAENFDRVVVMAHGHVIHDAAPADVFDDEAVLCEAGVHPPQLTRLSRALGWDAPALSVPDVVARLSGTTRRTRP